VGRGGYWPIKDNLPQTALEGA